MQKKEQTKDSTHECLVMNDVSRNCDLNVREDRLGGSRGELFIVFVLTLTSSFC